jgi:hypothetical protein
MAPNRWLHLRHPKGFTEEQWAQFLAHHRLWRAHVDALLADWPLLGGNGSAAPQYEFFAPTLSPDRCTVTIPIGGDWSVGSRFMIENSCSRYLWEYFPVTFMLGLEEGLTEPVLDNPETLRENWRRCTPVVQPAVPGHDA